MQLSANLLADFFQKLSMNPVVQKEYTYNYLFYLKKVVITRKIATFVR